MLVLFVVGVAHAQRPVRPPSVPALKRQLAAAEAAWAASCPAPVLGLCVVVAPRAGARHCGPDAAARAEVRPRDAAKAQAARTELEAVRNPVVPEPRDELEAALGLPDAYRPLAARAALVLSDAELEKLLGIAPPAAGDGRVPELRLFGRRLTNDWARVEAWQNELSAAAQAHASAIAAALDLSPSVLPDAALRQAIAREHLARELAAAPILPGYQRDADSFCAEREAEAVRLARGAEGARTFCTRERRAPCDGIWGAP